MEDVYASDPRDEPWDNDEPWWTARDTALAKAAIFVLATDQNRSGWTTADREALADLRSALVTAGLIIEPDQSRWASTGQDTLAAIVADELMIERKYL